MSDFSNSLHFICSNNYVFLRKSKSGSYALEVWLFFFWNPFFFKSVILLRNCVIFYKKRRFCGFFRSFFIFIKLFNIYWKINIILSLPLFSTLKNEENGRPKNCYTTNRKHCENYWPVTVSTAQGSERSKLRKLWTPKILTCIEISYSFGE